MIWIRLVSHPEKAISVQKHLIRDERAGDLLEMMLVFAVATILVIRAFLALTGYPQIGGGGLHIAHMLWGGLGMIVSIALLLSFWNPAMRQLGAAIGGIGFGFFIDELGKFVTSDNDYFFQPTIAVIYVIFIISFLAVRTIHSKPLTKMELSANKGILEAISEGGAASRVTIAYMRVNKKLRNAYLRFVSAKWFSLLLRAAFIIIGALQVFTIIKLVAGRESGSLSESRLPVIEHSASILSATFIIVGILRLTRSRISAYRWFLRSTLVNILITQVFMFYYSELTAIGGLIGHLLVYFALRFLIKREEELIQSHV
jgi:hypothetical protein